MKSKIMVFSVLKDKIGKSNAELELPETLDKTILLDTLIAKYPDIKPLRELLKVSVNRKYVETGASFKSDDEIAVFPPVSGG